MMDGLLQHSNDLERALLILDKEEAEAIIKKAVSENSKIETVGKLISQTLVRIGEGWEKGIISLAQVYMSGIICEEIIDKAFVAPSEKVESHPPIAIGVFEDFHMLGSRIISSTLRASGFEISNLGGGLTIESIIESVKEQRIEILLLSVLMLPSALHIKELSNELKDFNVKIIVGGAPFRLDKELWKETRAYAFGNDSADAIKIITRLTHNRI